MRKIYFLVTAAFLFIATSLQAQTTVFSENMETIDSVSSSGNPTWFQSNALSTSGTFSIRDTVAQADSAYLTTNTFSTTGNTFVILNFNHICKISFADGGTVEVSIDNGANWTQLTSAQYLGTSGFGVNNKFNSAAYPPTWLPASDTATPNATWWKPESFDLSAIAANAAQVKVRFKIQDGNNNGNSRNFGWLIDDIQVIASPSELTPPVITYTAPVYTGTVYNLGPFNITADITDASGIASATLFYTVNNGAQQSLAMTNTSGNNWGASIPAVADGDSICYYVTAVDASPAANTASNPNIGCTTFHATSGITFPFFDNFDGANNLWTPQNVSGSAWQLGSPTVGVTNSVHSSPNCWDIDLTTAYVANTESYLVSPVFDFSAAANAKLSFWHNFNSEGFWDGVRIDYSTDNGVTWQILGSVGDPNSVNWYNYANLNSSSQPGWAGNSQTLFGGWFKSEYVLTQLNFTPGATLFRFAFTSDGSVQYDGYSIDDFSIALPQPLDAGVSAITAPGASSGAGNNLSVTVDIKNYGLNTLTSIPVSYNGGAGVVTETWTGSIAPSAIATYTFTAPFTVPTGSYSFCAWTGLAGDGDNTNDTLCKTSVGVPLLPLPYFDDFEGTNVWQDSSASGTNWQLGLPNFGVTNSTYSGVQAWDINLTTAYGNQARSNLISPLFDFTGQQNVRMTFWHNRLCEAFWDGTRVEYSTDGGGTWTLLGAVGDPNATNWYTNASINSSQLPAWDGASNGWIKSKYKLGILNNAGPAVQFKFVFTSDFSVTQDGYTIDDFGLVPAPPFDASMEAILRPGYQAGAGSLDSVRVVVGNQGQNTLTAFDIAYTINNGAPTIYSWTGNLAPSATDTVNLPLYTVPTGAFSFCAYTSLATDGDHTNDTICKQVFGIPTITLPYVDNFDGATQLWFDSSAAVTPSTIWELGTPAFNLTTGAHSAPNAWDINLTTGYGDQAFATLKSPFFDFTNVVNARLKFWQNRNSILEDDGTRLEYSTDGGQSWNVLGVVGDPLGTNWYNDTLVFDTNLPAWDDATNGWVESKYLLTPLNNAGNQVQLRYVFTSNFFGTADGISIDDIEINLAPNFDAAITSFVSPNMTNGQGVLDSIKVTLTNYGTQPLTALDIVYSVNGGPSYTIPWTGNLAPTFSIVVALDTVTYLPGQFSICAYSSLVADGDHFNDTLCKNFFGIPTFGVPYFDDFESNVNFYTQPNIAGNNDWEFGTPANTVIDSAYTPVTAWKTKLLANYSGDNDDFMYSPLFDFSQAYNAELRFYHWFDTENGWDGGRVEYSMDAGNSWTILGSVGDPNATNWYTSNALFNNGQPGWEGSSPGYVYSAYNLNALGLNGFSTDLVQFRFNFSSDGFGNQSGWAVDNFELFQPITLNAAPVLISGFPSPFAITNTVNVSAWIKNKGAFNLTSVDATLNVDGTTIVTDPVNIVTPLAFGDSLLHTFSVPWSPSGGAQNVCVWTSNPNGQQDLFTPDDTICIYAGKFDSLVVDANNSVYCNDFDSIIPKFFPLNAYTYAYGGSDFEFGDPNKLFISAPYSGNTCWITNLDTNYSNVDSSGLFSNVFIVDTVDCYEVSFWHKFSTEQFQDGGTIEYSTNAGNSWSTIGYVYEPDWYNSPYITGLFGAPKPGWSGRSIDWILASHKMKFNSPANLVFRMRFGSDFTTEDEGWAIDNFCFKKVGPCVIGVNELYADGLALNQNYPNPANNSTVITYYLPSFGQVKVSVSNVIGETIATLINDNQTAGEHSVEMDVKKLAQGIYYYTLQFGDRKIVKKMVITQ